MDFALILYFNINLLQINSHLQNFISTVPLSSSFLNIPTDTIKKEPRDTSPTPYIFSGITGNGGGLLQQSYRVPQASPSPQPNSPATPHYMNNHQSPTYTNVTTTGGNMVPQNYCDMGTNPFQNYSQMGVTGINGGNGIQQMNIGGSSTQQWNNPNNQLLNTNLNPFHESYNDTNLISENTSNNNIFLDLDSHQVNSSELLNFCGQLLPASLDNPSQQQQPQQTLPSTVVTMGASSTTASTTVKLEQLVNNNVNNNNNYNNSNRMEEEQEILTDSFTRLSTYTINEITNLSNYNRHNNLGFP